MSQNPEHEIRYQQWLAEHGGILGKISRVYGFSETDRGDLLQELKWQIWVSLKSFTGQAKVSTWIYRVCLNTALTWRRGTQRRIGKIEAGADLAVLASDSADPAAVAGKEDLFAKLHEAMRALPELDRALVMLALDGVSYREIAMVTGTTENHVGVALTRARQRLAREMKGVIDELG
jgi:RNA polymerase sigma-70 factor (ECF subfamily)